MKTWANSNRIKSITLFLLVGVLTLLARPGARAQGTGATITGTVTDPSGAAVAGAEVVITNTATGIATTATTSAEGFYSVPNLSPGPYTASAKASGFSTTVINGVTLNVGDQRQLSLGTVTKEDQGVLWPKNKKK